TGSPISATQPTGRSKPDGFSVSNPSPESEGPVFSELLVRCRLIASGWTLIGRNRPPPSAAMAHSASMSAAPHPCRHLGNLRQFAALDQAVMVAIEQVEAIIRSLAEFARIDA